MIQGLIYAILNDMWLCNVVKGFPCTSKVGNRDNNNGQYLLFSKKLLEQYSLKPVFS